jgi:hypothetical protein
MKSETMNIKIGTNNILAKVTNWDIPNQLSYEGIIIAIGETIDPAEAAVNDKIFWEKEVGEEGKLKGDFLIINHEVCCLLKCPRNQVYATIRE